MHSTFFESFFFRFVMFYFFVFIFLLEITTPGQIKQSNEFHVLNRIYSYPVNLLPSSIQTPQHDAQRDKDVEISY